MNKAVLFSLAMVGLAGCGGGGGTNMLPNPLLPGYPGAPGGTRDIPLSSLGTVTLEVTDADTFNRLANAGGSAMVLQSGGPVTRFGVNNGADSCAFNQRGVAAYRPGERVRMHVRIRGALLSGMAVTGDGDGDEDDGLLQLNCIKVHDQFAAQRLPWQLRDLDAVLGRVARVSGCNLPNAEARSATELGQIRIERTYVQQDCRVTAAQLYVTEDAGTGRVPLISISTPMTFAPNDGFLSVPPQNLCSSRFMGQLQAFAASNLSRASRRPVSPSDIPLCSEGTTAEGEGIMIFRGFMATERHHVNGALLSAVLFDRGTGVIYDVAESANGL